MNDDSDLEAQLRGHLHDRADHLDVRPGLGGGMAVKEAARRRTATRHRRRMTVASVGTAAAVAAGLVVIARDPGQDVSTKRTDSSAAGNQGLAAGAATGSSTGSSSGSATGWTSAARSSTEGPQLADYALRVDPSFLLIADDGRSIQQGSGQAAADLAVAAEVVAGSPLRFVVASVQDSTRLSSGKGGTETTINGRPARVVSRRAATTITWDMTDTERVLVTAVGVDDSELADWLGNLSKASGSWAFERAAGTDGLQVIATPTIEAQASRYLSWHQLTPLADGTCADAGYSLDVTSGGAYELWAMISDTTRWATSIPEVREVALPGRTDRTPAFFSQWGDALVADGDSVLRLSQWSSDADGRNVDATSALSLLFVPTDAERPVVSQEQDQAQKLCANGRKPAPTLPPTTSVAVVPPVATGIDPETATTIPADLPTSTVVGG